MWGGCERSCTWVHTISQRVRMTDSEGLWPQLVCCASHLSMAPLISDQVQQGPNEVQRTLEADNSGGASEGLGIGCVNVIWTGKKPESLSYWIGSDEWKLDKCDSG
jgi:hypothetical protein